MNLTSDDETNQFDSQIKAQGVLGSISKNTREGETFAKSSGGHLQTLLHIRKSEKWHQLKSHVFTIIQD